MIFSEAALLAARPARFGGEAAFFCLAAVAAGSSSAAAPRRFLPLGVTVCSVADSSASLAALPRVAFLAGVPAASSLDTATVSSKISFLAGLPFFLAGVGFSITTASLSLLDTSFLAARPRLGFTSETTTGVDGSSTLVTSALAALPLFFTGVGFSTTLSFLDSTTLATAAALPRLGFTSETTASVDVSSTAAETLLDTSLFAAAGLPRLPRFTSDTTTSVDGSDSSLAAATAFLPLGLAGVVFSLVDSSFLAALPRLGFATGVASVTIFSAISVASASTTADKSA